MSTSEILLQELESLKDQKTIVEAQLEDINNLQKHNGSSSPYPTNGLEPHIIHRYSHHLVLPSFGVQGQANLLKSSILVVGAGGLGAPALLYFAASGVGKLGIVDHDKVELNNMHRQIIHTEAYIGQPKVKSAAAACRSHLYQVLLWEWKGSSLSTTTMVVLALLSMPLSNSSTSNSMPKLR